MAKSTHHSAMWNVLKRELLRIASSRVLMFTTIIAPLLVFLIVQWLFSAGVVRNVPVAIIDNDQTATSRKITRMVSASPVAEIQSFSDNLQEAKTNLEKGKIQAILVLPQNLEKNVFKGSTSSIALYINNTNLVLGGSLKSGLYKTLSTISAGIKLQMYMKKGATEYQAMQKVMPVKMDTHILFNPYGNYAYFLALALLPVLLTVFTLLGSLYALGIELKDGTAGSLMKTANNNIITAITGKFLPYTFLFMVQAMVMNLILFKAQATPLNGSLWFILLSEFMLVICYQALAVLFLNVTANLRLSLSLGSAYTMMALTFSGLTFPTMAMPLIAQIFGAVFPYTFWLKIFLGQSLRGEPLMASALPFGVLFLYFLTGMLAFPGLKRKLNNPLKWGKA